MMYTDIGFVSARREEERGSDAGACQVDVDLARPVNRKRLGELTGNNRTLSGTESGHNLTDRVLRIQP